MCWAAPVSSMKPMPPWTWTPIEVASSPISVEKALAIGVSSAARLAAAVRSACSRRVVGEVERQADLSDGRSRARRGRLAFIVISMRCTSACSMIGLMPSPFAARPWRRSRAYASAC